MIRNVPVICSLPLICVFFPVSLSTLPCFLPSLNAEVLKVLQVLEEKDKDIKDKARKGV